MEYFAVKWLHANPSYPVELYTELDDSRFEVRKVEIFPDGRLGYADSEHESWDTRLGSEAVPPTDEIAGDPEFEVRVIGSIEFEQIWSRAISDSQR